MAHPNKESNYSIVTLGTRISEGEFGVTMIVSPFFKESDSNSLDKQSNIGARQSSFEFTFETISDENLYPYSLKIQYLRDYMRSRIIGDMIKYIGIEPFIINPLILKDDYNLCPEYDCVDMFVFPEIALDIHLYEVFSEQIMATVGYKKNGLRCQFELKYQTLPTLDYITIDLVENKLFLFKKLLHFNFENNIENTEKEFDNWLKKNEFIAT